MRLDKYLSGQGFGTRSEVKKLIKSGAVFINEVSVCDAGFQIREEDLENGISVSVQGKEVGYKAHRYYMLNKPAGCLTATEDARGKTVMDFLPLSAPEKRKLCPVGRLDKDTEGLLLITDDGDLAHRLLSPKRHVDKCYFAVIEGIVTEEDVEKFAEGLELSFQALPARLKILEVDAEKKESRIEVTIQEGKYHQVKRMFGAVGKKVVYLKRISMGNLVLDETLKPGEYRELRREEVELLEAE
ncbi:MAG: rRNA pseudouridine synthase [Lachnospiraceae bacterium]|nr:rRNA pseudouridine synthase [Lachnospiraceae bacterium]